jgi:hypothetical protein
MYGDRKFKQKGMVVCLKKNELDLKGEGKATELVKSLQVLECGAVGLANGFYWCRFAWMQAPRPCDVRVKFKL